MGNICCCGIPDPKGPARDPLIEDDDDIVSLIITDPHIHYYLRRIQEFFGKKSENQRVVNSKEEYVTTNKK